MKTENRNGKWMSALGFRNLTMPRRKSTQHDVDTPCIMFTCLIHAHTAVADLGGLRGHSPP